MAVDAFKISKMLDVIYVIFKKILFFPFTFIQKFPPWLIIVLKVLFVLMGVVIFVYIYLNRDEWRTVRT